MADGPGAETAFDRATAVRPIGDARFEALVDPAWFGGAGPNGGYLAALVLRALIETVRDPQRRPRSLACQFLSGAAAGPAEVHVDVRKAGRSVTFLGASLVQDGRPRVAAQASFAVATEGLVDYDDACMPPAPAPAVTEPLELEASVRPPLFDRLDMRPALGPPPLSGAAESVQGGWLRLREPRAADPLAACLYLDGWLPAPTARLRTPPAAPTIDYTVHFRQPLPASAAPTDHLLASYRSLVSSEGLYEEDALLWSRGGVLLAQSRQLGMIR